jgi:hypothetical protein
MSLMILGAMLKRDGLTVVPRPFNPGDLGTLGHGKVCIGFGKEGSIPAACNERPWLAVFLATKLNMSIDVTRLLLAAVRQGI